ncbi:hypothetical protein FQA39_LY09996 [Lamprigera yunnana]|nr:hypothetical protein FQA39_LY09996 [Lamprigera yunnana]
MTTESQTHPVGFNVNLNSATQTQSDGSVNFHTSFNKIPTYDGNQEQLSEYIRAVEDIFSQFWQRDNPTGYIKKLLYSVARNRLKDAALEIVTGKFYGDEPDIIREYKIIDAKSLALRVYLGGLNEPFESFLRSRHPPNLEVALKYIKKN